MDFVGIIIAAAIVGATGILIGLFLGIAGEKFKVEVDEKELQVRDLLPGNNCGGCGYAGCDALAKAIANGEAPVGGCPVGGSDLAKRIGEVMGVSSGDSQRKVAFVKCAGTCDKASVKFNYYGMKDCNQAMTAPGAGNKSCSYGCMGLGSCVKACPFDALHIVNGIAKVDKEKCKSCGKCIDICPKGLIEFVPDNAEYLVHCSSKEKGKVVKDACTTGCIGCGLCVRACEFGAVSVVDNIAYIDQTKCTKCGKCAAKCPSKVIKDLVG